MTMSTKRTERREKPQMLPQPVRGQPGLLQGDATWGAVRSTKSVTYVMLALAGLVGGGGLLAFMLFLLAGPLNLVNLGLGETQALLLDTAICLAFFIQHSIMARKPYRQQLARFLPEKYYGALYAVASGVVALALVVIWQESAYTLVAPQGLVRWSFRAIFVLSIAGVAWTIWALGFFVNFRLRPIIDDLHGKEPKPNPLIVRGPYRWVRHPLYLSALLMIWSFPDLTLDRLLLNLLFTVWVIVATLLEERDLVAGYGEAYRSYQRKVPMLIPWRIRPGR
jgi:protein-S-isoprenylcysteine O-methyltransferase Ste14